MKHARSDYDRIQDPEGRIPDDEPVLLLRGQDRFAARAARYYASLTAVDAPDISAKVMEHANLMDDWPTKKTPDLPAVTNA